MTVPSADLEQIIESSFNRNGTTPAEQQAIRESINNGQLGQLIQEIDSQPAGPPAGLTPDAQALGYSGEFNDMGPGWTLARDTAQNSGGKLYWINQTEVGQFIDNRGNYNAAIDDAVANNGGQTSTSLDGAVTQIADGVASYDYVAAAPKDLVVLYGNNVDPNSTLYNAEIQANKHTYPDGTVNGLANTDLADFNAGDPSGSYNSNDSQLRDAFGHTFVSDPNTGGYSYVTGPNAQSATSTLEGDTLHVTTTSDFVQLGVDAQLLLTGALTRVASQDGNSVTFDTGTKGDEVSLNSGTLHLLDNAGGFGSDALRLDGSNTQVSAGNVDVLLIAGAHVSVSGGNSNYFAILTGSSDAFIEGFNTTVEAQTGTTFSVQGNDLTVNVGNPSNLQALVSAAGDNIIVTEINPDLTKQTIILNSDGPIAKDSISYLANGTKFAEAASAPDTSALLTYNNPSPASSDWTTTAITFKSDGTPTQQVTRGNDGSVYVTIFQGGSNTWNVTYVYHDQNTANAQINANNWHQESQDPSGLNPWSSYNNADAIIYAHTGDGQPKILPTSGGGGLNPTPYTPPASFNGDGGSGLSGVRNVEWFVGLTTNLNVGFQSPNTFLGSTNGAQAAAAAAAGDLTSTAVDPIVLNLSGGEVTTTSGADNGVRFDILGDGHLRSTGWVTPDEAFLVNSSSGVPTSGKQLLMAADLIKLDTDKDGVISASEGAGLSVWNPSTNKFVSLQAAGILDIRLDWSVPGAGSSGGVALGAADHGNWIGATFHFDRYSGQTLNGADVAFEVAEDTGTTAGAVPAVVSQTANGVPLVGYLTSAPSLPVYTPNYLSSHGS